LAFIRSYDHYRREGFGRWAVCLPENNQLIGFCGLRRQGHSGEVDLAFRFSRDNWSQGYATEASVACLNAGFQQFKLETITGRAMRENLPSITVLQKLGMKYLDMIEELGDFWLVYGIDAERFLKDYRHRS
jgi:RimJ/RimL family protein N-acetyltransferase